MWRQMRRNISWGAATLWGLAMTLSVQKGWLDAVPDNAVIALFAIPALAYVYLGLTSDVIRNAIASKRIMSLLLFILGFALLGVVAWFGIRRLGASKPSVAAPLISANFLKADRSVNYEVAGIKWQNAYSGLGVNLVNTSDSDEELNVRLRVNALVAKIGCTEHSGNSEVSFEPWTDMRITQGIKAYPLAATDLGYKMYCSHLPPRGHVTIVMALVGKPRRIEHLSGFDDPRFYTIINVEERGEKDLNVFCNDPSSDIYSARPNPPISLTVDGIFSCKQQSCKISKVIKIEPKSHEPLTKRNVEVDSDTVTPENLGSVHNRVDRFPWH